MGRSVGLTQGPAKSILHVLVLGHVLDPPGEYSSTGIVPSKKEANQLSTVVSLLSPNQGKRVPYLISNHGRVQIRLSIELPSQSYLS